MLAKDLVAASAKAVRDAEKAAAAAEKMRDAAKLSWEAVEGAVRLASYRLRGEWPSPEASKDRQYLWSLEQTVFAFEKAVGARPASLYSKFALARKVYTECHLERKDVSGYVSLVHIDVAAELVRAIVNARSKKLKPVPPRKQRGSSCSDYPLARKARVVGDTLELTLLDGKKYGVPLRWFPGIANAPLAAKRKVVVDGGVGLKWPILGYELGVGGLVRKCRRTRACKVRR